MFNEKIYVLAISFIILFAAFQVLSGYLVTFFYTPDITSAWNQADNLFNNTILKGGSSYTSLLIAFLAATLAYFIPKIFVKDSTR
ncbi:hypothetical protein FFL34_08515 [Lentibacillus cibarius]|uniref:Uncharacterized protein n=1 Tax=Lentibacillus cibarius TaxID=2583219 RepID=A0A5S3QPU2_9BACI|nr:hypothetical protein FFL34_08515 [Lentibacillus cibarius]